LLNTLSLFLKSFINIPNAPRIKLALVTILVTDFPMTSAVLGSSLFLSSTSVSSACSTA